MLGREAVPFWVRTVVPFHMRTASARIAMTNSTVSTKISPLLARWITRCVAPRLDAPAGAEIVRHRLPASHRAVRCDLSAGGRRVARFVLKEYFRDPGASPQEARIRARREVRAFRLVATAGLTEGRCRVARLLAGRTAHPAAVAVEFVEGADLAALLKRAARASRERAASVRAAERALADAAGLLARFHAAGDPKLPIWRSRLRRYPYRLLHALAADEVISEQRYRRTASRLERFEGILRAPAACLVHGDANPSNFVIPAGGGAVAVDLERVGSCDPAIDTGFLAADVIHLTRQYGGASARARRLVAAIAEAYRARGGVVRDGPHDDLFLAIGLWRIARNRWLPRAHRRWLAAAAERALGGAP